MSDKRLSLDLSDLDDDDLSAFSFKSDQPKISKTETQESLKKQLATAGADLGFVSRQVRKSPYTAQFGGRCRPGMKELFKKIGDELDVKDVVLIEQAILALLEKNKISDLLDEFYHLTGR